MSEQLRTILLTISYNGTHFSGWQRQEGVAVSGLKASKESSISSLPQLRTVQGELECALEKLHKHPVRSEGSGRTDSGVHAIGQTVTFDTDIVRMEAERFVLALNSILSPDIRIMAAKEMPYGFHARFNACARTYRYFIHCGKIIAAHELPFVWAIRRYPDIEKLNRMASFLRGEIDCTTFAAAGDKSPSKCRYIYNAAFFFDGEKLVFEITANAFLWRMVRSLLGTLLSFEQKNYAWQYFGEVLHHKNRSEAGPTAPSNGLFLWHVSYDGIRRGKTHISLDSTATLLT